MKVEIVKSSIKTGVYYGIGISLTLFMIGFLEDLIFLGGSSPWWIDFSRFSLLAGAIWGAFLTLNVRFPAVPGRFLYHLFTGVALAFTAALTAALLSYGWATIDPELLERLTVGAQEQWATRNGVNVPRTDYPAYHSAGNFALATYSFQFFICFSLTLLLSTVSCIWECVAQEEEMPVVRDYKKDLV